MLQMVGSGAAKGAVAGMAPTIEDGFAPIEPLGTNFRLDRDRALFREGDKAAFCYKIIAGAVRISKLTADGRRQIADFFLPGDLISFDLGGIHSCTAEAIVECVVRRYPKPQIERIAAESPRVARHMLALAQDRLASAQTQMMVLGRKTATERIATFLVAQAARADARGGRNLRLPMTRIDIADHLGLTVETVSRIFSRLKRDRVIDVPDAHNVVIRDWNQLEDRADM
jgi:CRP-like cAMP-binding protein